jgi:hypothetical protein
LRKLSKFRERLLSESTFLYREKLLSYIYIVERHVPFPLILQAHNVFLLACVLISIVHAI